MPIKRLRPVLAIAADLPLGRLLTSFRNKDRRTIPWIFSLFHALESQEDFDIHWITLSKAVSAPETIRMRNQTIHILPLGSMGRNILTAHFLTVRRIRKTLNDIQPDLLHVWGVEQAYALAGIAFRGKKLLSYQGALTAYCQRAPQAFLLHMQALWERMAVKHYDLITCESPWACGRVAEIAPHARLSCMEYGVEPSFYHLARKPSPEPSCLFAGTIYELKGISYLVEAFTHPSLSHVQLFIAGNGALRERLEALSTPNIHWLGSISRAELQQHLSTAWFLVHPTLGDCCPNIVKEARVMGLPVITTEEGGQTQYVQDGVSGYIVPVRNSAAVREAAQKLSVSLDKAMSMGMERHQECRRLLEADSNRVPVTLSYHAVSTLMKLFLIHLLSGIGRLLLRLRGVRTGTGIILSGFPLIKKFPGASITIGNGVTIHSLTRMNPVLSHHTCLAALSNQASIILEDGCGISGATLVCVNGIRIGRHTLIGADALILDNDMHYPRSGARWGSTLGQPEQGQPISIGEGCFIGARATILKGVTIGSGSVVAAGAVVTRDVPPGCLAIGNPAVNKPLPERLKHPRETQKAICP